MLSPQEIADIENRVDLVALVGRSVALSPAKGGRYVGRCPFHNDNDPSFDVNPSKGVWGCHACGTMGKGAISWVMKIEGLGFRGACDYLTTGDTSSKFQLPANSPLPKQKTQVQAIFPIPAEVLKNKPASHRDHGVPAAEWCYRNDAGAALFYVCRFNNSTTGKKEVLPLIWTDRGWRWLGPQSPIPLYGLDVLAARSSATVVIGEGEKTKQWMAERLPRQVAMSWMGGTNKVHLADWSPITGRKVILCPDADWYGWKAMEEVAARLLAQNCTVLWAVNPDNVPKGWDVADSGWDADGLFAWLKKAVPYESRGLNPHANPMADKPIKAKPLESSPSSLESSPKSKPSSVPANNTPALIPPSDPGIVRDDDPETPYIVLGYERTSGGDLMLWFYSKTRQMTMSMTPRGIGKAGMLQLASMAYWEQRFPRKGGLEVDMATNMLIQAANVIGMFDPSVLRGRGCWNDAGRVVIHAGNRLIVDGVGHGLQLSSSYVYEHRGALGIDGTAKPMSNAAAREYLEICKGMSWEKGVMPYLLAGWVVIAPLCGILNWRPHLWMIGPAGVGKSTIFTYLVSRMLGKFKMAGQGMGTTEAGIRQALASDALPYIADEMDATTLAGQAKLKVTLELFRSMSTAEGPKMLKGSGDGTSVGYELRSCVFLSSISAPLDVRADISRFYVLSLVKSSASDAREAWKQKLKHLQATLTDDYVERFQARTIAMIPVILQNVSVFGAAAVDALGDQRLGDQLGPLLAGAWSLVSNTVVSYEVALDWIKGHEWEVNGTSTQDEVQLLESIMDTLVVYKDNYGKACDATVAQLVRAVAFPGPDSTPSIAFADNVLRQRGMRVDGVYLYFAKNGEWFKEILKGRPFDVKILRNVAGAEDGGERKLSFAGTEKRWVRVPLASCGLTGVAAVDADDYLPF